MRRALLALAVGSCLLVGAPARADGPPKLPLRAVRFYETGVGYFERKGTIDAASSITLPLPTAHLDDALKSLVVMSKDGKARIAAVEFESTVGAELGRALAGVEGDSAVPLDWARVLRSLKGADVSVKTKDENVRGRLVDVIDPQADDAAECMDRAVLPAVATSEPKKEGGCQPIRASSLVLLADSGAVRRFRSTQLVAVQPVDAGLARRLRTALAAISPRSDQLPRGVRVLGTPGSDVTLGYVSETPVWRSTYRVVFGASNASLQGWALIHNDTDEDWKSVRVELVNGRPDAFLYPLAAPRYARRELVKPSEELSVVPQLLAEGSPDRQWTGGAAGGLGLSGVGEGGGGRGEGLGLGRVGTIGRGSGTGSSADAPSTELDLGSLAGVAGAAGVEAEALFRYSLPNPIDLRAHGTALVPFVTKTIGASRITWFPAAGSTARSAARIKNETGQTLPAGTIAFFGDGGFSGEALIERMKPDDMRVLGFGVDLDVSLETDGKILEDDPRSVTLDGATLREHFVRKRTASYRIENRSGLPREVLVSLQVVDNARVEGADAIDYDTQAKTPLARFAIARKTALERTLAIEEALSRDVPLGSLTPVAVERLVAAPRLAAAPKQHLTAALGPLRAADQHRAEAMRAATEHATTNSDIQRLRQNLVAAGVGKEAQSFRDRLLAAETRLEQARARLRAAQAAEAAAMTQVRAALGRLGRSKS